MKPENHYIDEKEEELLNDPDFIEALSIEFENDEDEDIDDDEIILAKFGY